MHPLVLPDLSAQLARPSSGSLPLSLTIALSAKRLTPRV